MFYEDLSSITRVSERKLLVLSLALTFPSRGPKRLNVMSLIN